jgi:hypothetical protein
VATAISKAYPLGRGTGPVNHLYGMSPLTTTTPSVNKKRN